MNEYSLTRIEEALAPIESLASAVRSLGNGNANTQLGAIENLAKAILEASENIGAGLNNIAEAIENKELFREDE